MASPTLTEIQVLRANLKASRVFTPPQPPLAEGEVRATVDEFALTANNVSYGVSGDTIGYWRFFPAEGAWGVIPVWGFATVIESRSDVASVGERVWGFLPMASHVVLKPGEAGAGGWLDVADHRQPLPGLYNRYQRTDQDPPALQALAVQRCALFPLFTTSYVIADFLADNAWFGARQVLILSASSKTGFGLADLLHHTPGRPVQVIGATSAANQAFVTDLGTCDTVIAYDGIAGLDPSIPTVVVDMAGSTPILQAVHGHFGDRLVYSCTVGATHWTDRGARGELPGSKPTFFFAPGQIAKREAEWGRGEILRRAQIEGIRIAQATSSALETERIHGAAAAQIALTEMIAGQVSPRRILMLSLSRA